MLIGKSRFIRYEQRDTIGSFDTAKELPTTGS
jgi:hypothetical protein